MDTSVFFRRRTIFWCWIVTPLACRILIMIALSVVAREPAESLKNEELLSSLAPRFKKEIDKNQQLLELLIPSPDLSTRERFLTDTAQLIYETDLQGNTLVTEKEASKNSKTKTYVFSITGHAPSLENMSIFLDKISRLDYLIICQAEISEGLLKGHKIYNYSITFERTELAAGVSL